MDLDSPSPPSSPSFSVLEPTDVSSKAAKNQISSEKRVVEKESKKQERVKSEMSLRAAKYKSHLKQLSTTYAMQKRKEKKRVC